MPTAAAITRRLSRHFPPDQASVLAEVIEEAHTELVKTGDFNELKEIVRDLAEAQKRTEEELATLTGVVRETNRELGGLGRSFAYALENEAYRNLPRVLEARFGIVLTEKMVRTEVGREEVNLLGRGTREGRNLWIVGETKARVDLRTGRKGDLDLFGQLERKVAAVREAYGEVEVVRLILTHFATRDFLAEAERRGVLVIQSFEW